MNSVILFMMYVGGLFAVLGAGLCLIEKFFDICPSVSKWFDGILGLSEEDWECEV